ncbi:MAG: hypothetical protein IKW64_01550 [Clostridia bacterium]|nr:hypothetical protein [Clostridia bacterium]
MKKFYESPIVELTVFDVEDVITTSAITSIDTAATGTDVEALIADIQGKTYNGGAVNAAAYNNSYSW